MHETCEAEKLQTLRMKLSSREITDTTHETRKTEKLQTLRMKLVKQRNYRHYA